MREYASPLGVLMLMSTITGGVIYGIGSALFPNELPALLVGWALITLSFALLVIGGKDDG